MEDGQELCDTRSISNEAVLFIRDEAKDMVVEETLKCLAYVGKQ